MKPLEVVATTQREEKTLRKVERILEGEDLRNLAEVMELPAGRRLLWKMLERCRIYETTLAVDGYDRIDPLQVASNEGERQLGLWLVDQITEANPEGWLEMQREKLQEQLQREATATKATTKQGVYDE